MRGYIATLNAGSSSIKFAIFALGETGGPRFKGQLEKIGVAPALKVLDAEDNLVNEASWPAEGFDHQAAASAVVSVAAELAQGSPVLGIGHRVVHGGEAYAAPIRIDADVLEALTRLAPLAPLHQPHNLAPIQTIARAAPHIPQVACFDTAFHRTQPQLAQAFALPRSLTQSGVRRYGFHGLSYEYVSRSLKEIAPDLAAGRVIIAHLGNGASLCAVNAGQSVASTMGFTAVDGLMMGTRCGSIDPGVLIYLMDEHKMDARALEDLIYKRSGLLGVSGVSSDMRELRASDAPSAKEAISLFTYRVIREIGSLAAALGGVDGLIFSGGIGEHDAGIRADVCAGCAWLGVRLDEARNAGGAGRISSDGSAVSVWVVPTDEEKMIALHTTSVLGL
jgi:acetate kinase